MSDSLRELASIAVELGEDERRVLVAIARRLAMGAETYGRLHIRNDRRDWHEEAEQELLDGCVYLACKALRKGA